MRMRGNLDVVTGAFSYTGKYITRRLLASNRRVRTLTGHPERAGPTDAFAGAVEARPFAFERPQLLTRDLADVDTLYNTYWIRFARCGVTHETAVAHLRALIAAAAAAGVRRVVHISITGASSASPLPYFRGKGEVEDALAASGLAHAILRPALIYGPEDVLVHNIAWIARRFPIFPVFGDGRYPVQPVDVEDLAALAVQLGAAEDTMTVDAVGPETYPFRDWVRQIAQAVGRHPRLLPVSPATGMALAHFLSRVVGDVVLTRDEISGLMAGYLAAPGSPTTPGRFSAWLHTHADTLGRRYASELARHYDRRPEAR